MKIPKQLKVGGHIYKVNKSYKFKERSDRIGYSDRLLLQINITPFDGTGFHLKKSKVEEAFFHELLHCVDDIYNAGKLGEDATERLSNGLYQVLKDNNLLRK